MFLYGLRYYLNPDIEFPYYSLSLDGRDSLDSLPLDGGGLGWG